MPSKSPAQAKLMRAVAHGWKPDRMKGPSRKVAKEFVAADKKAKGYQFGGLAKMLEELKRKQDPDYDPFAKYGTEPLTLKQAQKRSGKKGIASFLVAAKEMGKAGWTQSGNKWYPPQATATAPQEEQPVRTIDPVPGREFISGDAPPRQFAAAPPRRAAADVAPGFNPGRVPPALAQYLQSLQGGAPEEPVKMQGGGAMNFLFRGKQPMQQVLGGGFTGGGFGGRGPGQPQGGGGQFKGIGRGMNSLLQQMQQRRQAPGGGAGQGQPRPQQTPGTPGAGVPLRGVGRPPGMGRPDLQKSYGDFAAGRPGRGPGAGGYESNQPVRSPGSSQDEMRAYRAKRAAMGQGPPPGGGQATTGQEAFQPGGQFQQPGGGRQFVATPGGGVPTAGSPFRPEGIPFNPTPAGGGGAGMPGGANRIGMADQQGALARASQVQTGRPPISRRQPFPGGPGGGFGGRRRRGRGRMRR